MTKITARWRQRKQPLEDGKPAFQAFLIDCVKGAIVWRCDHQHQYGASNRYDQDSAQKCAYAEKRRREEEEACGDSEEN